jgi:error-prone DNA polymerase
VDLLGLGMMAVLQDTLELCSRNGRGPTRLHEIPMNDEETYASMRRAETVGVFQIESRAQMATLPRLKPREFYDVAMQVAIVRPGPIVGNLAHPLIRRRNGLEAIEYIDPSVDHIVKPILERTMGVVLFQEQMLELGMQLASFTGGEAEELRRAMGFSRNNTRLERALEKFVAALRRKGRNEAVVKKLTEATLSFASYGFPESHAISFALLAYASTWFKVHRPAEFLVGLLNNQPMGFYSPSTLLQDARRRGNVKAKPVCVCQSDWRCTVEDERTIRIGLCYVKGLRRVAVEAMLTARADRPFDSLTDFLQRTDFSAPERRALASVGALNALAAHRRAALWQIEAAWSGDEGLFQRFATDETSLIPLEPMSRTERFSADFAAMSLTTGVHPMTMLRDRLPDAWRAGDLPLVPNGERVTIAGSVICRQRPGTAKGFVFVSLEDETGIANAVVPPMFFEKHRLIITQEPALLITGKLQNSSGVIHVRVEKIVPLREADLPDQTSHDFR